MGTATTYSTARSPLRRGASCVLSDWAHNLSMGSLTPRGLRHLLGKRLSPPAPFPVRGLGQQRFMPQRHVGIIPATDE